MRPFIEAFPENVGRLQHAPVIPDHVEDVVLGADTLTRLPVPEKARFALFSFDGNVRVRFGGPTTTLTLPVATSGDGQGSELNPVARRLAPIAAEGAPLATHICLRAAAACSGSVSFYA